MSEIGIKKALRKMEGENICESFRKCFEYYYHLVEQKTSPYIYESDITSVPSDKKVIFEDLKSNEYSDLEIQNALNKIAVLKLNGGLGTSMGLEKAKSLLDVKNKNGKTYSFLDIICEQILYARKKYNTELPLILLNSFRTHEDSIESLKKYPEILKENFYTLLQEKEPKLSVDSLEPIEHSENRDLEWCPPGHGQLFNALYETKICDELLEKGLEYIFISNADNLGATIDKDIAVFLVNSKLDCLIENTKKTETDIKGGHLVEWDGRLYLREFSQVAKEDEGYALDTNKHPYFNVNNIWISIKKLRDLLEETKGVIHLPLIQNKKTVDPSDPSSKEVLQLETAAGSIVSLFENSKLLVVNRSRFLPVKTTSDMFIIMSDYFNLENDFTLKSSSYQYPKVILDSRYYKNIKDFKEHFSDEIPSLSKIDKLTINGNWYFGKNIKMVGEVILDVSDKAYNGDKGIVPDNSIIRDGRI